MTCRYVAIQHGEIMQTFWRVFPTLFAILLPRLLGAQSPVSVSLAATPNPSAVSYTHLDVYKRQVSSYRLTTARQQVHVAVKRASHQRARPSFERVVGHKEIARRSGLWTKHGSHGNWSPKLQLEPPVRQKPLAGSLSEATPIGVHLIDSSSQLRGSGRHRYRA